ncbi:hypothetical protein [Pseudomonas sp. W2-17]|uniref:hypothetical protein n=1 Tax=Pseudomonas sp. W2-17 TaxID=3058039 RepID=UPI0034E0B4B9
MTNLLMPSTSATLRCDIRQPGLLGRGQQGFAGESAMNFYMRPSNVAGRYPANDYTAALFLVYQLSSPDQQMSPAEVESAVVMLRQLLVKLQSAATISVEALQALQAAAESIPEVGPLMFSPGNLPGSIASISGAVLALKKSNKVSDLLDLTEDQKSKLKSWAKSRGTPGAQSASKTFKGAIKIISQNGDLFFEIPVTAAAQDYKILGEVGKSVTHIPLANANASLNQTAHLHGDAARGTLRFLSGNTLGMVLAVGPQGYLDWASAKTKAEFWKKTAYNQPTNVLSFLAGWGTGLLIGFLAGTAAPLFVVITLSTVAGLLIQKAISHYNIDKAIGDYLISTKMGSYLTQ